MVEKMQWGGPPGPRPAPWPASLLRNKSPRQTQRGRPGGWLRTGGSAPLFVALAVATSLFAYTASITPDRQATLDRISSQSLQGHIWFLASDLLEGRDTPSRGLDVAAEYIAAQFRRAGLKPAGDDGYFQTAHYVSSEQSVDGAELTVHTGEKDLRIGKED